MTAEVYTLHPRHHCSMETTMVYLKSRVLQALLSREGIISLLIPLCTILLGLAIAAVMNAGHGG